MKVNYQACEDSRQPGSVGRERSLPSNQNKNDKCVTDPDPSFENKERKNETKHR